jgi:hypothetical protein
MSMTQRPDSSSERIEAQTTRMFLLRAAAQAEAERRRAAQVRLAQLERVLPRDDR